MDESESYSCASHRLQLQTVPILPKSLQNIAIFEGDVALTVDLAVFELSHIDATVILLPFKLARPVDQVILEVTGQDSNIGMQRSISLFLTIDELPGVSETAIEF